MAQVQPATISQEHGLDPSTLPTIESMERIPKADEFDGMASMTQEIKDKTDQIGAPQMEASVAAAKAKLDEAQAERVTEQNTLIADAERATAELFETVPVAERMPYLARRHGSVNQGYFPIEETTIIHPDLVEGWVFCRRAFDLDGNPDFDERAFWPRPGFEQRFRALVQAQERLILPVMQSVLRYLGCDPHLYDTRLTGTNFGFRLNYYPAPDTLAVTPRGGRMLGHEDVDLFTFLPAPAVEGLQVFNQASGSWIRLDAPRGGIILNIGDYMQRISNDRLRSTTHRVSQARDPAMRSKPRISTPMAVYVWEDELLEVLPGLGEPKYPPIKALHFHTRTTAKYYGADYAV